MSLLKKIKSYKGFSVTGVIIALAVGATLIIPVSRWLLSLNAKISNLDEHLEAMNFLLPSGIG